MKSCAIIGSTKIAEIHVREFLKNGIVDITVISRNLNKSRKFSKKLSLKFKNKIKFSNLKIISKKKFDFISICSNAKYHLENLQKIKNKKCKILVEKPLMDLKKVEDLKNKLDQIYLNYPNLFVSYPMYYLANFFIKNFKLDKKLNSINVYYQTRGVNLFSDIFLDLAPHALVLILVLIKNKKLKVEKIFKNIKKKSFMSSFLIKEIQNEIKLLQLEKRKKSIFKFYINKKEIKRITQLKDGVFLNFLEYKRKRKFLINPMSSVIKNFVEKSKLNKEYKINKKITYQLSFLTKLIYD